MATIRRPSTGKAKSARHAKASVQALPKGVQIVDPKSQLLRERIARVAERLVDRAPPALRAQALSDENGVMSLARLLCALPVYAVATAEESPLAAALAHGALRKEELLAMHPHQSITEVARLLHITPQAIQKRIKKGTMLALPVGDGYRIPLFQVDARRHAVDVRLRPLFDVAAANQIGAWTLLELLTTPIRGTKPPQTVIDWTRSGRSEAARRIVAEFGEHGG